MTHKNRLRSLPETAGCADAAIGASLLLAFGAAWFGLGLIAGRYLFGT